MKTPLALILALLLGACANLTTAQKQQVESDAVNIATAAAVAGLQSYDTTGKINSTAIATAAANQAAIDLTGTIAPKASPTPAP